MIEKFTYISDNKNRLQGRGSRKSLEIKAAECNDPSDMKHNKQGGFRCDALGN